jgi:hypothetical protein
MKVKDIEVGKEYVYGRSSWGKPDKVLILAKNHPDPTGRTSYDRAAGQRVVRTYPLWGRIFSTYGSRDTDINPSSVVEPWDVYEQRLAEQAEQKRVEQEEVETRLRERAAPAEVAMQKIAVVLGTEYTVHHGVESGWAMVTMRQGDLETLAAYVKVCSDMGIAP